MTTPVSSVESATSRAYQPFVAQVRALARGPKTDRWSRSEQRSALALTNGAAGHAVKALLAPSGRSAGGVFFTTTQLSRRTLRFDPHFAAAAYRGAVLDPACGAGDLLLSIAEKWPVQGTLAATLEKWGARAFGIDMVPAFVHAARLRLILLAALRGGFEDQLADVDEGSVFLGLRVGDGLTAATGIHVRTIVLNPPFTRTTGDERWKAWSNGKSVSLAAAFVDSASALLPARGRLVAILPDALRSGVQLRRWRECIARRSTEMKVHSHGRFSADVDVDVFLLSLTKAGRNSRQKVVWPEPRKLRANKIGSKCAVTVGAVVPHRTSNRGAWAPFLTAADVRHAPNGATASASKRFVGRLDQAPFVVVQRTSAPGDRRRPVAAIVRGRAKIAVENHLLILRPVTRTVRACRALLRTLKSKTTRRWLDKRYRCRHLTVDALREIPLSKKRKKK